MATYRHPSWYSLTTIHDESHPSPRRGPNWTTTTALANGDIVQFYRVGKTRPFKLLNAGLAWGDGDGAGPTLVGTLRLYAGTTIYTLGTGLALGAPGVFDAKIAAAAAAALPPWMTGVFRSADWALELIITAGAATPQVQALIPEILYTHDLEDNELSQLLAL